MHMRQTFWLIGAAAVYFLLFFLKGILTLDSDFGWHIRMGQIILEQGIPKTDPFSYTMPSYPFVDHEWLLDAIVALLYPLIGMNGLSIIFALIGISAFLIQVQRRFSRWALFPMILVYTSVFSIAGVRMQLITWFLFSIFIQLLTHYYKKRITGYLIVPFLFLWANLHGGFPLGLVYLVIFYVFHWIQKKKIFWEDCSILLLSIAVTFINPYGYMLWWEEWKVFSDHSLRFSILEWMPAFFFINVSMGMYIVISVTLLKRYWRRFSLDVRIVYVIFLIAGISSYRHMPIWIIISLNPTLTSMEYFYKEVIKYKYGKQRLHIFYKILTVVAVFVSIWEIGFYIFGNKVMNEHTTYPKQAIVFLKNNLPAGNIFSTYEWGGYLDWKLPEKKVFIDGRMPSARWKNPPPNESSYAFEEYRKAKYGSRIDFEDIMKKYNVAMILVPRQQKYNENAVDWIFRYVFKLTDKKRNSDDKYKNYRKIYEDNIAVIYSTSK